MTDVPRVTVRKQVSDSNYGNETFEISMDALGDTEDAIAATLAMARRLVQAELRHSPSTAVTRAVTYQWPADRDIEERANAWALSNANAEEHAIVGSDDDEEDPF